MQCQLVSEWEATRSTGVPVTGCETCGCLWGWNRVISSYCALFFLLLNFYKAVCVLVLIYF